MVVVCGGGGGVVCACTEIKFQADMDVVVMVVFGFVRDGSVSTKANGTV
jgi:hypothetical protein